MERYFFSGGLSATVYDGHLRLSGDLNRSNSAELLQWLPGIPPVRCLELGELDIDDGVAATQAVNAVRLLCTQVTLLRIDAAPQVLAHNLYRTGLLAQGNIELIDMREDEAYG